MGKIKENGLEGKTAFMRIVLRFCIPENPWYSTTLVLVSGISLALWDPHMIKISLEESQRWRSTEHFTFCRRLRQLKFWVKLYLQIRVKKLYTYFENIPKTKLLQMLCRCANKCNVLFKLVMNFSNGFGQG